MYTVCFFRERSEGSTPVIEVEESDGRGRPFSSGCASSRNSPCGQGIQRDGLGKESACRSSTGCSQHRDTRGGCLARRPTPLRRRDRGVHRGDLRVPRLSRRPSRPYPPPLLRHRHWGGSRSRRSRPDNPNVWRPRAVDALASAVRAVPGCEERFPTGTITERRRRRRRADVAISAASVALRHHKLGHSSELETRADVRKIRADCNPSYRHHREGPSMGAPRAARSPLECACE